MADAPSCFLFAGPTLVGDTFRLDTSLPPDITLLSPVRRGDIASLVDSSPPGAIAIVDGNFHQCLAVGHAELRDALACGWRIWGLSSMGAIRACEMRFMGLTGFGDVYTLFAQAPETPDDEVALLHEDAPGYRALTEPMVHLSAALEFLAASGLLSRAQCHAIADDLRGRWYGERSLTLFRALVRESVGGKDMSPTLRAIASFDRFRIKSHDLSRFLEDAPWRQRNSPAGNEVQATGI